MSQVFSSPSREYTDAQVDAFLDVIAQAPNQMPDYLRKWMVKLSKAADDGVRELFFPEEAVPSFQLTLLCRELSVRYVSYILAVSRQVPDLACRIQDASYTGIAKWVVNNGTAVGQELYNLYLNQHLAIPQEPRARSAYLSAISKAVTTTAFIRVTQIISASQTPVPAQLLIQALLVLGDRSYNDVISAWGRTDFFKTTYEGRALIDQLFSYSWLEEYKVNVLSDVLSPAIEGQAKKHPDRVLAWLESPTGPREYNLLKADG